MCFAAVCEKCGAIGVKHAFYTKERRFCSLACAREYSELERTGQTIPKPYPLLNVSHLLYYILTLHFCECSRIILTSECTTYSTTVAFEIISFIPFLYPPAPVHKFNKSFFLRCSMLAGLCVCVCQFFKTEKPVFPT
jgi:hypothetical protein